MSDKLKFRVSSGIKDIVGKDLITDDFIAVFELVKNSYDAEAKNVQIIFEDNKIIIADDGKGMSYDDIQNKWLYLAYSAKKDGSEDSNDSDLNEEKSYRDKIQARKHYAGSKGIGRFSADKLGKKLILSTKVSGENSIEQIEIDWSLFDDQLVEFDTIDLKHETLTKGYSLNFPNNANSGVILEIVNTDRWTRDKIIDLRHSLEKLINPFSENHDFNIEIICKSELFKDKTGKYTKAPNKGKYFLDRDKVNGRVKNSILEILELKTTQISVKINSSSIITKIFDRGANIYHIEEDNLHYPLLTETNIDLYFLNHSAKLNFINRMGIPVVNFGSVFLFKNGFRVQPFGKFGDDSWDLDQRKQQGYNRFLGTRDLFGRVEVLTENTEQFKEVSSRDGGLVETKGYYQLMNAFKEKALVRLERYVVGVLWGEGFKKRKYFGEDVDSKKIAEEYRKELLEKDKVSDNISIATSNLGSKLDFIQIIKSLATNKDIRIVNFNSDFIDLINHKLDKVQSRFITDLEKIAETTNDPLIRGKAIDAEKKYKELLKAKDEAEKRAEAERKAKIEAEKKAEAERKAKIEAEKKQKKEEERRRKAELQTIKKEKERVEAELAKLKAEKKAKEEEEKRKKAEKEAAKRKEQITRYKASETIEYKDLRDSNHIIGVYSDDITKKILLFKRKFDKGKKIGNKELLTFIKGISLANEKIATIARFTTKSNFLQASLETNEDVVAFINNYIKNIYQALYKVDIEVITNNIKFIKKFQPIELSVVIDNILSNSRKKRAAKVIFDFEIINDKLKLSIKDIGKKLSEDIENWKLIFEEGITTTKGAGLGLNHVKRIIEDELNGEIVYNPEYKKGFELIITMKK